MGEKISWMLNVQVQGGPKIAASDTIEVDAYDKFEAKVLVGETKEIQLQPSDDVTKVDLILIKPDKPHEDLTYTINALTDSIKLDAAQLLIGEGAVSLFAEVPTKLVITNGSPADVFIQILVGREAITLIT